MVLKLAVLKTNPDGSTVMRPVVLEVKPGADTVTVVEPAARPWM